MSLPSVLLSVSLFACTDPRGPGRDPTETSVASTPEADPAADSLAALRERSLAPVTLQARRGVPSAVFLEVPVGDEDPIEEAWAFLEEFAPLYRLSAPREQLYPRQAVTDDYGTRVRFVQRSTADQGGLPLFDSGLTVHMADGRIYLTTGRYMPDLTAAAPQIGWEEALAGLQSDPARRGVALQGQARLGLYAVWSDEGAVVHTVWRMTLTGYVLATGEPLFRRVDVDAVTGALVHEATLVATCDRDFDIMYGYHGSSDSCWAFASTDDWFDADGTLPDYSASTDHNGDGFAAFDIAHAVYDYYEGTFGQCSYDDDDAEVEIVTHAVIEGTVASATGYCGTMQFRDDATTLDIVAHEFTHLVDYNANDLEYEGQSGALDESFADVFGSLVDGDWTIGEDLPGGAFRSLADPSDFGDPDHVLASLSRDGMGLRSTANPSDDNDWGNVHTNSGIPNKAAFLVIEGGTHNGFTIQGLGRAKGEQLYHAVHVSGLEDDADFRDARDALVGTALYWGAIGWHGFDLDDYCQVSNAFASVGVATASGDKDCDGSADGADEDDDGDGTSDGPDNCPTVANPTQSDLDLDGAGDACDDDLDGDGDANEDDNCLWTPNPSQFDADGDGVGDLCDDTDHDGVLDVNDNCPDETNWAQDDADGDGWGDVCDGDADNDGLANEADNCELVANADQLDADDDDWGDVCDNCPTTWNPDQDRCACADELVERLSCMDLDRVLVDAFVHPLDQVALPDYTELDPTLPDDFRLELTVVGTSEPWMITDTFGNVVARSQLTPTPTVAVQEASWVPALDYRYRPEGGKAAFATDYHLLLSPTLRAETEVQLGFDAVPQ